MHGRVRNPATDRRLAKRRKLERAAKLVAAGKSYSEVHARTGLCHDTLRKYFGLRRPQTPTATPRALEPPPAVRPTPRRRCERCTQITAQDPCTVCGAPWQVEELPVEVQQCG